MNLDAPAVTALKNAAAPAKFLDWMARHLDWPIGLGDFETPDDILYDFTAADLDIKPGEFAKIRSLRQLPPLETNQPWGIFLVEFEANRFSVTALRKILSRLVPSRRNSLFHPVWRAKDLLFLCFWGSGADRTVCLARFAEEPGGISSVRTIHCAPAAEDATHLMRFANRLVPLRWPASGTSADAWHKTWNQAFGTRWRAIITSSELLAAEMADLAVEIHNRVLDALEVETDDGFAHRLFKKVKSTLLHDVDESQFADMYAQTIVYGLFSARCLDLTPDTFSVDEAISLIPNTNPFLKGLMKDCFSASQRGGLSFDELGIGDVVDLFANVDAARIAADFGRRTGQGREDPVIYFYEEFLKRYDSAQKIACGEFYTPQPVVAFMVRAVDSLLKTRFTLPDGLATATSRTIRRRIEASNKTRPEKVPSVQILDPATGTGTFLRQVILNIHAAFSRNYRKAHSAATPGDIATAWSDYVDKHLLPRLNGFELMMAPYAIAHMKLALVLQDTGYNFQGNGRLRVFLTNSLEEPGNADPQLTFWSDPLAAESIAANAVKKNPAINVVIGNPPYSVASDNRSPWILSLLKDYKKDLNERHINLDDDYIKFIRLGQEFIRRSGQGILAYISNNSFIGGITHRQMRKTLMEDFDEIFILDLHGNAYWGETCPDGSPDKNVFDIKQGVSINIFVKTGSDKPCVVQHAELWGDRAGKFKALEETEFKSMPWRTLFPVEPNFFFIPKDFSLSDEYNSGFGISELLGLNNSGIKTDRDALFTDIDKTQLEKRIKTLLSGKFSEEFMETYRVVDSSSYKLTSKIQGKHYQGKYLQRLLYHPFDLFWIYYDPGIISRPAYGAMQHLLESNLALCCKRGFDDTDAAPVFCVDTLFCMRGWSRPGSNGAEFVFPLYLHQEWHGKKQKVPNPDFLARIPKADLHLHLDGSLRLDTLIDLAHSASVPLPSDTAEGLQTLVFKEKYVDLPDYLKGFGLTTAVLQTPEALERVSYELALDCIAENVPYIEVRFAPQQHVRPGQTIPDVLRAVNKGLARAAAERNASPDVLARRALPFRYGIIACAMRFFLPAFSPAYAALFDALPSASLPEIHSLASLDLARACAKLVADEGIPVVAIDLAGAENGFPAAEHIAAYQVASEALLFKTIHAGEAYGPESIYQAIAKCHADRIGHGTWLLDALRVTAASVKNPQAFVERLAAIILQRHITLEVCPTSNLQTLPEIPDIAHHPVLRQLELGLPVSISTDNRLISRTTPARELGLLAAARADTPDTLRPIVLESFRSAFYPGSPAEKADYVALAAALYDQAASA